MGQRSSGRAWLGEDLAGRHPWLVRVMLLACALGLVATVEDIDATGYRYVLEQAGPYTELGPYPASGSVRVVVRANALGLARERTTENLSSFVKAELSQPWTRADVLLSVTNGNEYGRDASASRELDVAGSLDFTGDCSTFSPDDPCEGEFFFNIIRMDQGAEPIVVSWSVTLRSSTFVKDGPTMKDHPGPWTLEIIPQ